MGCVSTPVLRGFIIWETASPVLVTGSSPSQEWVSVSTQVPTQAFLPLRTEHSLGYFYVNLETSAFYKLCELEWKAEAGFPGNSRQILGERAWGES